MRSILLLLMLSSASWAVGQSFEFMPGTERIFIDAQWLKAFDADRHWTLFSRSRATVDYDQNTDLFTGAYLNYTTSAGVGGTLLGRISSLGAGLDGGVHFFKARERLLLYALVSVQLKSEFAYSWFSILRFLPPLNDRWKLYTSLELFSNFNTAGHAFSVQRIRAGVDREGWQFGLALNLSGVGADYILVNTNPGLFIRKEF